MGSIYRYFEDKRELLYAVTEQRLEPVVAMLDAGATFESSVKAYIRRANDDGEAYRMMFWLAAVIDRANKDQADSDVADDAGWNADSPATFHLDDYEADHSDPQPQAHRMAGAFAQSTSPLPQVIERIIEGWGKVLGDQGVARACWAMLHGSMMLGLPADQIVQASLAYAAQASPQPIRTSALDREADAIVAAAESSAVEDVAPAAPVVMPGSSTAGRAPAKPVVEGDADFRAISGRPRAAMTRHGELAVPVTDAQAEDEAAASVPVQPMHEARSQEPEAAHEYRRSTEDVTLL